MPKRWKPRVTVAAIVCRLAGGEREYLLVEEHTAEGLRLNNPAGHLDPGESLVEAVIRETLEETACAFVPEALVGVYLARQHGSTANETTYLRFAFAGSTGEPDRGRPLDTGIVRTLWLGVDAIRERRALHRSPLVMRCIDDHLAGRRWPLDLLGVDPSVHAGGWTPPGGG
jgi:8-oxo-dGTP pyrophosphatase MutT (NUDIX family)